MENVYPKGLGANTLGKPVFTDDITPRDALVIKLLRSPYANAIVEDVKTDIALKVPGMVAVYTWEDVPKKRFFYRRPDISGPITI